MSHYLKNANSLHISVASGQCINDFRVCCVDNPREVWGLRLAPDNSQNLPMVTHSLHIIRSCNHYGLLSLFFPLVYFSTFVVLCYDYHWFDQTGNTSPRQPYMRSRVVLIFVKFRALGNKWHDICDVCVGCGQMAVQMILSRKMSRTNRTDKSSAALMNFPDVSSEIVEERKRPTTLRATPGLKVHKGCSLAHLTRSGIVSPELLD